MSQTRSKLTLIFCRGMTNKFHKQSVCFMAHWKFFRDDLFGKGLAGERRDIIFIHKQLLHFLFPCPLGIYPKAYKCLLFRTSIQADHIE